MTEGPAHRAEPKRVRWSREHVRALAWVAGSATFFTGVAVLGAAPRLVAKGTEGTKTAGKQNVAVRRVTRKVYVIDRPSAPSSGGGGGAVYSGGGSYTGGSTGGSYSGGSTGGGGGGSTGGGGGTTGPAPAPAPAPPPACSTGPSPTC